MSTKYLLFAVALACVSETIAQVYKANSSPAPIQEVTQNVEPVEIPPKNDFITQTVYGFLDFTTTIGNTVMVFSPQSAPPEGSNKVEEKLSSLPPIETKPAVTPKKTPNIQASKTIKGDSLPETKKQNVANKSGTKIAANSIIEQSLESDSTAIGKNEKTTNHVESSTRSSVLSSVVQVRAQSDTPGVKNNLAEPEYDFLSKQPTEIVDETYKLINLRPSSKTASKPRPSPKKERENPTGLVTRLGGTIVKDGLTTVHETSVIGTYINGKYAQVLQSTSRILKPGIPPSGPEGKIRPSSTQRILKTIGPQHGKLKPQLEPTPTHQQEESSLPLEGLFAASSEGPIRTTRKLSGNHQARSKFRNKIIEETESNEATSQQLPQPRTLGIKNRPTNGRPSYKNRQIMTTTESSPTIRRRSSFRPSINGQPSGTSKLTKSRIPDVSSGSTLPIPKVKLPRTQGRWSYKTTPKPRIAIRKQIEDEERVTPEASSPLRANDPSFAVSSIQSDEKNSANVPNGQRKIQEGSYDDELDPSETEEVSVVQEQQQQQQQQQQQTMQQQQTPQQGQQQQQQQQHVSQPQSSESILPVETINVEISTPADLNDIYFEIATIKTPYTFQIGTMKNTRYVTVTSTIKKTFATAETPNPTTGISPTEPLTENILANTGAAYESTLPLDSSIATLPPITLESGQATPPLETLTETFSATQTLLKTHVLPVVSGGNTTRLTLVQTYSVTRLVTATKTLPPMEIYQFVPSKTLNEFNSKLDEAGSELHLELDFGDDESDDDDIPKRVVAPNSSDRTADSDLNAYRHQGGSPSSPSSASSPSSSSSSSLASSSLPSSVAKTKMEKQNIASPEPQLTPEQIQQIALFKYFSAGAPSHQPQQHHHIPQLPQLFPPPQQPQFTVTSAPHVTQTLATVSDSRVLKLTFGAKTAFTTLYSTKVVPTEITTYITSTVPVQPTVQAFPGFYPPPVPYPPYPFVG